MIGGDRLKGGERRQRNRGNGEREEKNINKKQEKKKDCKGEMNGESAK